MPHSRMPDTRRSRHKQKEGGWRKEKDADYMVRVPFMRKSCS